MKITDIFMLVGGLALFLYGMNIMGEGLELVAGSQLKKILEKLTTNKYLGMLVGLVTTAIIQSSSATTVMVVGFVNAGLMNLTQAIGVIMGANIGTTVTGQLIALNISDVAPVIAFVGIIMIMFTKKKKINYLGQVVIGLGILFIGMNNMSNAMIPLREVESFRNMMTNFSNPLMGILIGAGFTCLIQSSSASIGILQALASQGLIGLGGSLYIIFGQNIGTCITSVLASIGSNKNAKRTALCHVLFNIIRTIIFIGISSLLPFQEWMEQLSPGNTVKQIANVHTVFNIVTTLMLLPFSSKLADIALKLIPGKDETGSEIRLEYLENCTFLDSTIAIANLDSEVNRMIVTTRSNIELALNSIFNKKADNFGKIEYHEELINFLNKEITKSIVKITVLPLSTETSKHVNDQFMVTSNLERIGDHAENISENILQMKENKLEFSEITIKELHVLESLLLEMFETVQDSSKEAKVIYEEVFTMEIKVDDYTKKYRQNHIERMKKGECQCEVGIIYDELLTQIERVADHIMNIAESK